jgi:hypothetical protein
VDSELAFFTTEELIGELMRRTTFLGVVIHTEDGHGRQDWRGERVFKVQFNANLQTPEACRLLDTVAQYMNWNHC